MESYGSRVGGRGMPIGIGGMNQQQYGPNQQYPNQQYPNGMGGYNQQYQNQTGGSMMGTGVAFGGDDAAGRGNQADPKTRKFFPFLPNSQ